MFDKLLAVAVVVQLLRKLLLPMTADSGVSKYKYSVSLVGVVISYRPSVSG